MKRFWESLKKWANRHEERAGILVILTFVLIGSIIGCVIGAAAYHPVEVSKIESLKSIAKDVYKDTYEFVQKYEIPIELSSEKLSEITETDLSLFRDLTASVEKSTVRISEKDVTVKVDFSKENTNVQEQHSRLSLLLSGIGLGGLVGFTTLVVIYSITRDFYYAQAKK